MEAPLLTREKDAAGGTEPGRWSPLNWVRRAASWRGPEPTPALLALAALSAIAFAADRQVSHAGKADDEVAVTLLAETQDSGQLDVRPELLLNKDQLGPAASVLLALACALLGFLACQYIGEKLTFAAIRDASRSAGQQRLGTCVALGTMRMWLFAGSFSIRNSTVMESGSNPRDFMMLVRGLTISLGGLWGLVRCAWAHAEVQQLKLEDIDVVVQGKSAGGDALMQALAAVLDGCWSGGFAGAGQHLHIKQLVIENMTVTVVANGNRVRVPNMQYEDFSKSMGVSTMHDAVSALVAVLARAALAGAALESVDQAERTEEI